MVTGPSFSQTINSANTVGTIGGLSTGSLAANTWYAVYGGYNGSSQGAWFDPSFSSPTIISGYTKYALIGAVLTDGSKNFIGFTQFDRDWFYKVGSNLSGLPTMASGGAGTPANGPTVAVAIGAFVPTTIASKIRVVLTTGYFGCVAAPNANYGGAGTGALPTNPPILQCWCATGQPETIEGEFAIESTNVYWAAGSTVNALYCAGFTISL